MRQNFRRKRLENWKRRSVWDISIETHEKMEFVKEFKD